MDDKSQMIVSHSARFGYVHDPREFGKVLKKMDREIVGKSRIIVGDKGYDSEENHIVAKRYGLFAVIPARNENIPIRRTRGENRGRLYSDGEVAHAIHNLHILIQE